MRNDKQEITQPTVTLLVAGTIAQYVPGIGTAVRKAAWAVPPRIIAKPVQSEDVIARNKLPTALIVRNIHAACWKNNMTI